MIKSIRSRTALKSIFSIILILAVIYYGCFEFPFRGTPFNVQRHGNPPLTPGWALECWLWEDDDNAAARDGTATLFHTALGAALLPYQFTHQGPMTTRTYMDHYYRDEYQFRLSKNPEFLTMSRAIDNWYHPEEFAPIDASSVNWVGDQRHSWDRLVKLRETTWIRNRGRLN